MIIDKKGKLFGKINIIDFLVLLILLVSVSVCVLKFSGIIGNTADKTTKITYTLRAKAVRSVSCDAIKVGDKIYDVETKAYLGKIKNKRIEDAYEYVNNADGTFREKAKIPTKYDIYFDVECDAKVNDQWYYLSNEKGITNYAVLNIYSNKIEVSTTVMNIKE
ncbi:MAG: DUF4330 domain-containing protein [Ruminococcaceae bacterium]|nr:DUF4330 domain-containing protein [Oscillospiraceae bacterium]